MSPESAPAGRRPTLRPEAACGCPCRGGRTGTDRKGRRRSGGWGRHGRETGPGGVGGGAERLGGGRDDPEDRAVRQLIPIGGGRGHRAVGGDRPVVPFEPVE